MERGSGICRRWGGCDPSRGVKFVLNSVAEDGDRSAQWFDRPRIQDLRTSLVESIPCKPETASVRAELATTALPSLILHYINYADRFVPPRPRAVSWASAFWRPYAQERMTGVFEIVREIEAGADLRRRLSPRTLSVGFAPSSANRWEDKDFALNAYDVHHLHLGRLDKRGEFRHADPLLFLTISRFHAHLLMLGNHKSFGDRSIEQAVAVERARAGFTLKGVRPSREPEDEDRSHRMARIGFATSTSVAGEVVPLAMLTTSGHRLRSVQFADRITETLERVDPQIDEVDFVKRTFGPNANRIADPPDFIWRMQYLDLSLIDLRSRVAGVFLKGHL